MSRWHMDQLIELIQVRYPDWIGFDHPQFVEDEIKPKQKLVEKARQSLALDVLDEHINHGEFELIFDSLKKLTRQTTLLWRRVPSQGDTAVFYTPTLNKSEFSVQLRNLLYGDRTTAERLQTFSDYLTIHNLPNKWPLPSFLLFLLYPKDALLVRPKPAKWLLQFMGQSATLDKTPNQRDYEAIIRAAKQLQQDFQPYAPKDMVDIQSIIWIGMRESKNQVGSLDRKSQVYLDVPPATPIIPIAQKETAVPLMMDNDNSNYLIQSPTTLAQVAEKTGHETAVIQRWLNALERKGQLIFYGPPGTGKTFVAQQLANYITQGAGFFEIVQFHPTYSYEDFVEGLRPFTDEQGNSSFERVPGRFLQFCAKAEQHDDPCVLIIDEINRANLTAVLGELMLLLEYREQTIQLAGGTPFAIPANIQIIATMNSADRSLALVDFALRRRFSFISLQPNLDYLKSFHAQSTVNIPKLIQLLNELNQLIDDPHYHIGHTYFLVPDLAQNLQDIWEMEIEPYLREYFLNAEQTIAPFRWEKIATQIIKDNGRSS